MEGSPGSFPSLAPGSLGTVRRGGGYSRTVAHYGECDSPEAFPSGCANRLTDCITLLHSCQEGSGESRGQATHGEVALPAASPAQLPSLLPLHHSPGLTHPIWGVHPKGSRGTSPHLTDKDLEDPGRGCGWPRAPAPGPSPCSGHWGRDGPRPRAPPLPTQGPPLQEHRVPPCLCRAQPTRQVSEPLWTEGIVP